MENKKSIFFIMEVMALISILIIFKTTKSYAQMYGTNQKTSIAGATVNISGNSFVYDGQKKTPGVIYVKKGNTIIPSSAYTISYKNNLDAGTGFVYVDGIGDYSGRAQATFKIEKKDISSSEAGLSATTYTYDGTGKKPGITLNIDNRTLVENKDYRISYTNYKNAGTATATITGLGNYTGSFKRTYTINKRKIKENEVILHQTKYTYVTGATFRPNVSVKVDSETLRYGSDYTVKYSNNTSAGTGKVTITGGANYTGTVTKTFVINKVDLSQVTSIASYNHKYNGQEKKPGLSFSLGVKYKLVEGTDYTLTYSDNKNAGTAKAKIVGKGNYTGNFTLEFKIDPLNITNANVTVNQSTRLYNGEEHKPGVVVKYNNVALKNGTDYEVKYSNNKNAGTAKIKITGKGNYTGTVERNFTIMQVDITNSKAKLSAEKYTYNGEEKKPQIKGLKLNDIELKKGIDYTIEYMNNKNPGKATAKITGVNNYKGSFTRTFEIVKSSMSNENTTNSTSKANNILKKAEEIKQYMAENKYEYCVVGPCRMSKDNPEHNSHVSNSNCGLSATFEDSKKHNTNVQLGVDGYHNVCCATYVSWVLREAGIIDFTYHGAISLADRLLLTDKFDEVTEGITKGKFLEFDTKAIKPGDIIAYEGVGHIEIAADAKYVYSAGSRWDEIWVKGATHRRDNSNPNEYNRAIYRVLRVKE